MGLGKTYSTKYLLDSNNSSGVAGQVLSTTSTGIDWVDANTVPGTGLWLANGNDIYNSNSGNVGIGVTAPSSYDAEGDNLVVYDDTTPGITIALPQTTAAGSARGSLLFSDGTSGSEKYRGGVIYDHGTGMGGQADTMYLRAAVNSYLVLNASGNVGIGIKEPTAKLHLFTSGSDPINLGIQNSERYYKIETDGGYLTFNDVSAGGTARMVIDSSGNVGIDVSAPDSYNSSAKKLVVGGSGDTGITISTSSTNMGTLMFADGTGGTAGYRGRVSYDHDGDYMRFDTSATEKMRIDSAGSTTITTDGTVDATTLTLTQTGGIVIDEALGYLNFYSNDPSTSSTGGVGGIAVRAETAFNTSFTPTYMSFYTHILTTNDGTVRGNVTERMRITSGGNVGIGTDSPDTKLHVKNESAGDAMLTIQSTSAGDPGITMVTTNDRLGNIFYRDGAASSTSRLFSYDHAAQAFKMYAHNQTTPDFYVSETQAYFAGQNVGIGVTNPSEALEVNSGSIFVNGENNGVIVDSVSKRVGLMKYSGHEGVIARASTNDFGIVRCATSDIFDGSSLTYDLYVSGTGDVGIGTTSPDTKLEVRTDSGAAVANSYFRVTAGAQGAYGGTAHFEGAYNDYGNVDQPNIVGKIDMASEIVTPTDVGGTMKFFTKATGGTYATAPLERMRIKSNGQVNISQKPNSGLAYDVLINLGTSPDGLIGYQTIDQLAVNLGASTGSNWIKSGNDIYNTNSANVGIGTTLPQRPLHVNGTEGAVRFTSTASGNSGFEVGIGTASQAFLWQTENSYMHFATNSVERMRITASGNSFFNYTNETIETYGSGVYGGKVVIKASGAEGLALLNNAIGGASQVAINFTNEFVANQYNFIARIIAEPEQSWTGTASTRDARLMFFTSENGSAAERMRISSAGNVGINVSGLNARFQVKVEGTDGLPVTTAETGTLSIGSASSTAVASLLGRQTSNTTGLYIMAATSNGNTVGDMVFNVRENNNTTFSTLTRTAFLFSNFGTSLVRILRNGNVGINTSGTTSSTLAQLTINQDSFSDTEGIFVQSGNNASDGGVAIFKSASKIGTISALGSASSLTFMTNGGSEKMRIDSSGSTILQDGIDYTVNAPAHRGVLILAGPSAPTNFGGIEFHTNPGGGAGYGSKIYASDANWGVATRSNATAFSDRFAITGSTGNAYFTGSLGIGLTSTPLNTLHVAGSVRATDLYFDATSTSTYKITKFGLNFQIWGNALVPAIEVLTGGTLKLGSYALSGTGTPTYFLGVDSSGNVVKTNSPVFTGTCTATNFLLSSDKTLKEKIKDIETKHVDVEWKNFELISEPGVKRSGVIAQELEKKHPEFVRTNDEGLKSVAYIDLLISKIAELEARLEKAGI